MYHRPEAIHIATAHSKIENSVLGTNDEIDKISVLPASSSSSSFLSWGKLSKLKKDVEIEQEKF